MNHQICEVCNIIGKDLRWLNNYQAMIFLKRGNLEACQEFLKKAENVANKGYFRALTLNNWACFYRSMGKLRNALKCLTQALEIETLLGNFDNMADIHLNMCVILYCLGYVSNF